MSDELILNHGESLFGPKPVRLSPKDWRAIFVVARKEIYEAFGNSDVFVYTAANAEGKTVLHVEAVTVEREDVHTDNGAYDE